MDTLVSGNTLGHVAGQALASVSGPQELTSRQQTRSARLRLTVAHNAAIALSDASQVEGVARTTIWQADFDSGTYRIKAPGIYVLGENVAFYPNPPTGMPTAAQRAPDGEYEGNSTGWGSSRPSRSRRTTWSSIWQGTLSRNTRSTASASASSL